MVFLDKKSWIFGQRMLFVNILNEKGKVEKIVSGYSNIFIQCWKTLVQQKWLG